MTPWPHRTTISWAVNEILGVGIIVHEVAFTDGERPFILALAGALMGLPFVLAADGKVRQQEKEEEDERWSHLP